VRAVSLPEVPYGATAVRPGWHELPAAVRTAISARLGAPVTAATSAGGGFTRAFAAILRTGSGERVFVKAAPLEDPTARWYAREAALTDALPAAVRAARPRWTLAEAGYFVLCLDAVDGHVPALPWSSAELDAALDAWSVAAAALARPAPDLVAIGLPPLSEIAAEEFAWWTEIEAGREPVPPAPGWAAARIGELAALERALPAFVTGDGMLHGDLRVDNVLVDPAGAAWLCDWTWPCLGAPWFDTVTLLVSAYASGLDADARLAPWEAPDEGVDAALAALGGYWLVRAAGGTSGASPHSRQHHRFSGEQALAWLADRRGWTSGK
jgi:aminoglycoside phosphotransferase (APT) family kinase protein